MQFDLGLWNAVIRNRPNGNHPRNFLRSICSSYYRNPDKPSFYPRSFRNPCFLQWLFAVTSHAPCYATSSNASK